MLLKDSTWTDAPPRQSLDQGLRDVAAALLRALGALLDRWADGLTAGRLPDVRYAHPTVEFHAEAGASDGALYINGCLIGRIEGVRRL